MINDVNHFILIGTLGEDAKTSTSKKREPVTRLRVATSKEWIEGTEIKRKTNWNTVFFFGNLALATARYKKGMKVNVTAEVGEGKFRHEESDYYQTMITGHSVYVTDLGKQNQPSAEIEPNEITG